MDGKIVGRDTLSRFRMEVEAGEPWTWEDYREVTKMVLPSNTEIHRLRTVMSTLRQMSISERLDIARALVELQASMCPNSDHEKEVARILSMVSATHWEATYGQEQETGSITQPNIRPILDPFEPTVSFTDEAKAGGHPDDGESDPGEG